MKLAFLIGISIPVFYYDIRYRKIPNWLTFGSWILYSLILTILSRSLPLDFLLASVVSITSYLLINILTKGKLGMGDVKLSLILGGINGVVGWYFTNLMASIIALLVFYILFIFKKVNFQSKIPFGPFLCTGGIAHQILSGYGIL